MQHTNSYYAATLNSDAEYPQLQGEVSVDVAVVGAGFSGINTALELAERGYTVAVIEASRVGWGASGRNGGQIIGGYTVEDLSPFARAVGDEGVKALYQMGAESTDIIRQRVAQYNIDCDLVWGYCDVAIKRRHMREFEQTLEQQLKMGAESKLKLLDKSALESVIRSERYIGGLYDPEGAGHCHPLNLCLGEARAAAKLGVRIFEQSRVQRIIEGDKPVVVTDGGRVVASHLVLCCNAYIDNLVPAISSRILPCNSSIIATEVLTDEQVQSIMPANVAACDQQFVLDYFRLSADQRLLFGGLANYTGREPRNLAATMSAKMLRVFPQLQGVGIDYAWSGQIGIGFNRLPQLGRLNSNIYYAQAYSGHGVAPTHMMGRIIAAMIDGQAQRFDIFAAVKHMPFPGGKLLRGPMYSVGILYYRLLDML